jgi:hypothetical protein
LVHLRSISSTPASQQGAHAALVFQSVSSRFSIGYIIEQLVRAFYASAMFPLAYLLPL